MGMFLKYFKTGIFVGELSCRQIGIRQSGYEPYRSMWRQCNRKKRHVLRVRYIIIIIITIIFTAVVDIIKILCFIHTHCVSVSVFAHNVEQIAYSSDHDTRLAAVPNHRVCLAAACCTICEHGGVKTDEYVFHQALRRLFVHFVLNEFNKKKFTRRYHHRFNIYIDIYKPR